MIHLAATSRLVWEPAVPPVAILAVGLSLGGLAAWTYLATGPRLGRGKRVFLLLCRVTVVALICLLLLQPSREEVTPRRQTKRVALVGLDVSRSMAVADAPDQSTRLDASRAALLASGLMQNSELAETRLFAFAEKGDARAPAELPALRAEGESTRLHESVTDMLGALRPGERPVGLFLFTDGRDFEGVSAARTVQAATARQTALFPVPVGRVDSSPDVAVRLTGSQPSTFVRQQTQIQASLRVRGAAGQPVRVELLREGNILREQRLTARVEGELPVVFDVLETNPGQYEYEVRAAALPGEQEVGNNSVFTFLNVTDARLRVLLLEGQLHWDTTFLQRTLARSDRVALDVITAVGAGGQPLLAASGADGKAPQTPRTAADFAAYQLVILGRGVDRLLDAPAQAALAESVTQNGQTVVFARGPATGDGGPLAELSPAEWLGGLSGPVRVTPGRSPAVLPRDVLAEGSAAVEALPDLPVVRATAEPKELAAVEAVAAEADSARAAPAVIHRRQGRGQVLAVTVEGLWKWSLHAKSEPVNNVYDRFWNQLLLNLVARSAQHAGNQPQLTVASANVMVGEKVRFTLFQPDASTTVQAPVVSLHQEGSHAADVTLAPVRATSWEGDMLAVRPGRYRAEVATASGPVSCRFAVFQEQLETTDTAVDLPYLQKLATASGGRVLDAAGLTELVKNLRSLAEADAAAPPIVRRWTLWDRRSVFWLLAAALGLDWFLRRRWGLT